MAVSSLPERLMERCFWQGSMKMVKVDGHRVCLVHTSSGVHAIDHACPHEGYGLTQGDLDGDLVTGQHPGVVDLFVNTVLEEIERRNITVTDEEVEWDLDHGTRVEIALELGEIHDGRDELVGDSLDAVCAHLVPGGERRPPRSTSPAERACAPC